MLTEENIKKIVVEVVVDIVRASEKRLITVFDKLLEKRIDKLEFEIQGDIRRLGEGMYKNHESLEERFNDLEERFDQVERKVDVIQDTLDLKSKTANEGFNLGYEANNRAHEEFSNELSKHHDRLVTLERKTGGIKDK